MTTTPTTSDVAQPLAHELVRCGNCGRYGWHVAERCPDAPTVALPPGVDTADDWQPAGDHPTHRVVHGADRKVTDHAVTVSTRALQWADATIDIDGQVDAPSVNVFNLGKSNPLNSDQARELASALLEAAAQIDGWALRCSLETQGLQSGEALQ